MIGLDTYTQASIAALEPLGTTLRAEDSLLSRHGAGLYPAAA